MQKKEKKRILADFYKKLFNKSWMQKVDKETDWHYPSEEDLYALSVPDSINSSSNLGTH